MPGRRMLPTCVPSGPKVLSQVLRLHAGSQSLKARGQAHLLLIDPRRLAEEVGAAPVSVCPSEPQLRVCALMV